MMQDVQSVTRFARLAFILIVVDLASIALLATSHDYGLLSYLEARLGELLVVGGTMIFLVARSQHCLSSRPAKRAVLVCATLLVCFHVLQFTKEAPSLDEVPLIGRVSIVRLYLEKLLVAGWFVSTLGVVYGLLKSLQDANEHLAQDAVDLREEISRRERLEFERQKLADRIQQSQKAESLTVLAGGVAHDFNNLLMGILGNSSLVLADLSPDSPYRRSLEQIEKAAEAAADLCRQMLAYSGRSRFVVESVDLNRLLRETVPLAQSGISKAVRVELDLATDLPVIEADATQIRQIILNLVTNAVESLKENGGTIVVRTRAIEAGPAMLANAYVDDGLSAGRYCVFEVVDTGCGIDAETYPRIFDPFFTTKRSGRGLGLAAVLGIVRAQQGAIMVETKVNLGTTFRVLLPAMTTSRSRLPVAPQSHQPAETTGKILVVDDEDLVREITVRMLEQGGYQTLTAADGREAIAIARQHSSDLNGIVLDLTMSGLSGADVVKELRDLEIDLPILLTSGYDKHESLAQIVADASTGFLQKPYTMTTLLDAVREVIRLHNARHEPVS